MKKALWKKAFVFGALLPLAFGVVSCDKKQNNAPSQEEEEQGEVTTTYTVTLNQGEGYVLTGAESVKEGAAYSFSVSINNGYDASEMVVKCNNDTLTGNDGNYVVPNVHSNLNITVEGVYKESKITLQKSLYRLELNSIEEGQKAKSYYLNGVSGVYRGAACEVDVDISEVDFTLKGTYNITYFLVGHESITRYAAIEIYSLPVIENVTIDLSNTYVPVVSYSEAGQVHVDFEVKDNEGHILTVDEIKFSPEDEINYLTVNYCRTLQANQSYNYKVIVEDAGEDVEIPFSINVTDTEEAKVLFSKDDREYACLLSDGANLPTASVRNTSAQNISFVYLLNGEEVNPETYTFNEVGDYQYKIKVIHNEEEVTTLERDYLIHIIDSYDLTDEIDLNGKFLFYNTDIFTRYFVGPKDNLVAVNSVNTSEKTATLTGSLFIVSNELIATAKERGFNHILLSVSAREINDNPITSMPYVSQESGTWDSYWNQNGGDGNSNIDLDLNEIDLESYPNWYMQISFRTEESGQNDARCNFEISNLSFEYRPVLNNDWSIKNRIGGHGTITETNVLADNKVQVKVEGVSYDWDHVVYLKAHEMYEAGLTICTIEVEGNNHNVFAYANNEQNIPNYNHPIAFGGGKTKLTLTETDLYVGVMTSHENTNVNGNQDEAGVYGKYEDMTITMEFNAPKEHSKMYSEDAWTTAGGSINFDEENEVITGTGTWSLYFAKEYAAELYEQGFRTLYATFTVSNPKTDYLTTVVNGLVKSYKNDEGVYNLAFLLAELKNVKLTVRTNNQDVTNGDHNTGCTGNTIAISNISLSNDEDVELMKANARDRLSKIFYTQENCWTYIRHNEWGVNSWGPDCTQAVFGTESKGQSNFQIQNIFLQDMKTAGYTKLSFHVKGVSVDNTKVIGNIALTTAGGAHPYSFIYKEYNSDEATFILDLSTQLLDLSTSDYLIVQMRTAQPEVASVPSIITLSALSFEE